MKVKKMKIKNLFINMKYVIYGIGFFMFIYIVPIFLCVESVLSKNKQLSNEIYDRNYYEYYNYKNMDKYENEN